MVEKRRGKQKKHLDEPEKPSKEEYAVSKHLRFNVPSKEGKLMGMSVQYFIASKAVDGLLDSKWASSKEPLFTTRGSCVDYCQRLLEKGLFHRASRVERKKEKKKKKVKDEEPEKDSKKKAKSKAKEKEKEQREKEEKGEGDKDLTKEGEEEKASKEKEESEKKDEEKKKKKEKKLKMEMHDDQVFKDGDEVYVWIYDPVRPKTFIIGLLLVLGAIAVCLFPLWPPEVRLGVYYISLAAAGFVGVILSLCVVRLILFCIVWLATFGNHYFWFLPNLTEDVGFFDSFKPLYMHNVAVSEKKETEKAKDKSDKDKTEEKQQEEEEGVQQKELEADTRGTAECVAEDEEGEEKDEIEDKSSGSEEVLEKGTPESGSENGNGYEIVDPEDIEGMVKDEEDDDAEESEDDAKAPRTG